MLWQLINCPEHLPPAYLDNAFEISRPPFTLAAGVTVVCQQILQRRVVHMRLQRALSLAKAIYYLDSQISDTAIFEAESRHAPEPQAPRAPSASTELLLHQVSSQCRTTNHPFAIAGTRSHCGRRRSGRDELVP